MLLICLWIHYRTQSSSSQSACQKDEKWLCIDNQVFMRFVPKMNGVEYEETMWKYSPKSWGMHA